MFILAVTFLAISSESVRQVLEDSVANASLFMADNMVLILAFLAAACVLFSTMGLTAKNKTHAKALPPVVPYWAPVIGNFVQFAKQPVQFALNGFQKVRKTTRDLVLAILKTFISTDLALQRICLANL